MGFLLILAVDEWFDKLIKKWHANKYAFAVSVKEKEERQLQNCCFQVTKSAVA